MSKKALLFVNLKFLKNHKDENGFPRKKEGEQIYKMWLDFYICAPGLSYSLSIFRGNFIPLFDFKRA